MIEYDDYDLYDNYPDEEWEASLCEECDQPMIHIVDSNYGADADGNRGMYLDWWECGKCG